MDGGDTSAAPCTIGEDEYGLGIAPALPGCGHRICAAAVSKEDQSRAIGMGGDNMIH